MRSINEQQKKNREIQEEIEYVNKFQSVEKRTHEFVENFRNVTDINTKLIIIKK